MQVRLVQGAPLTAVGETVKLVVSTVSSVDVHLVPQFGSDQKVADAAARVWAEGAGPSRLGHHRHALVAHLCWPDVDTQIYYPRTHRTANYLSKQLRARGS